MTRLSDLLRLLDSRYGQQFSLSERDDTLTLSPDDAMTPLFRGRVAVVSGAAHGIGRAAAERFAVDGAQVGLIDVDASAGEALSEKLGDDALFVEASVADADAVSAAVDAIAAHFGRIDIVHANAGVEPTGELAHELEVKAWREILGVNLDGVFYLCRAAIPHLLAVGGGSIICTSSIHAQATVAGVVAYASAKGGVDALVRALALDYAEHHIRVNAVLPGAVETPMLHRGRDRAVDPEEWMAGAIALQPLGRLGQPEEVAELVAFLASDRAAFITGVTVPADGGALAGLT